MPRPHVIFDVDGVLVDSYIAHFHSWLALADECGCRRMTEDEFRATFGQVSREIIRQLWPSHSLTPAEVAALDDRKEALYRQLLQTDFRPISGARELIVLLKQAGFGIAAGSSGPPENVYLTLDQLEVRDLFDVVVTATDVTRGKPDPEVFTTCAQRLAASPAACAVIDDAVVGIEAANRAGTYSIALVAPGRDASQFAHAQRIVRELHELTPDAIRSAIHQRLIQR
ncbi:MAG: HAD family phosphatase [Pirellulaceae bacterium]|jgi:beta-phosphoglucomutase|nr:HAD family phosphatase [Pirellulaceae bacterium]